jgi:nicotinamide-nucleotide amidase
MNTNAEIITIGDEILIGQVIDTNSAWLAQQLNSIGINVYQITSVSDDKNHIINALKEAYSRVSLILVTGGLGPTKDDITKKTLATYFNCKLIRNEEVLNHINNLFKNRGILMNEVNNLQADVPDICSVLHNTYGTAPGMWIEKDGKVFVFMPGVPFEMKEIVSNELLSRLEKHFKTPSIIHKTLMLQGIPESHLSMLIEPWEVKLPANLKLAYLPSPGIIKLRLTAKGGSAENLSALINQEIKKLMPLINEWYYGEDEEQLEVTISKLLKNNNKTISTAESCTGGKIAEMITSVPGSSSYFKGSVVAYSNEIKVKFLNVNAEVLNKNGAVSQPVVEDMARNIIKLFDTDFSIAVSGIAGPDGGTPEKPVGTAWIAVASKNRVNSVKYIFSDNRERNIIRTSITALNQLRKLILLELEK